MDILTPKGKETLRQEREAIRLFSDAFPEYQFVETNKDRPADIDGLVLHKHGLVSCVEVKCRNMHYEDLMGRFDGKWLVTHDKIERGISVSRSLATDFRGFLYLVPERILFIVPIWSYEKGLVCSMELEQTETQATVNGGTALRLNAFIDVRKARQIAEY